MCGIAGIWGEADGPLIDEMLALLAPRGPDAQGKFDHHSGTLGHRRLSIMDPQGGDQPIYDAGRSRAGHRASC